VGVALLCSLGFDSHAYKYGNCPTLIFLLPSASGTVQGKPKKMKKILLSVLALLAFTFGGTAQTLPSYVPANGLVGWWPFNGNANDLSASGNNLNPIGDVSYSTDRFNNQNSAVLFNSANEYFSLLNPNLPSGNNSRSVSMWINFSGTFSNTFGASPFMYGDLQNGGCYKRFGYYLAPVQNQIDIWWHGKCNPIKFNPQNPSQIWSHFVLTYESSNNTISLFQNGQLIGSQPITGGNETMLQELRIGSGLDGENPIGNPAPFNGKVDEVGFWDRVLTQQEITALYQGANTTANCPTFPASLTQGLVGYWPFCGNALDESGNNNHGTVNGATLTTDRFGNVGSAYGFDGVNDRIEINNNPVFNQGPISISAWIRVNNIGFYDLISKDGQGNPNTRQWTLQTNNKLPRFGTFSNNGEFTLDGQDTLVSQKWVHLVGVYSLTDVKIFQNGVQVGSLPTTGTLAQGLEPLRFGGNVVPSSYFNGSLDDIAIWNRALTPQEIQQVYNQGICQTSITVTDTLLIHTGITSYNPVAYGNTVKVWPNPGNTAITLDAGNLALMQGWKIRISNAQGAQIYPATGQSGLISQQQQTLTMSGWGGNGLYFLYLIDPQNNIQEVKKIVLAP
jgi:hypothetical protein